MKLYGISGLGADKRVFQYLTLDFEFIPIDWIEPLPKEAIADYAMRLSKKIDTNERFGIIGVSFGGLVAVEISKQLSPALTILISSAETKHELRAVYRAIGNLKILKLFPRILFNPPKKAANWLFGAQNKKLLGQILDDTDLMFAKWAVIELTNWKNTTRLTNHTVKIAGTKDKMIPPRNENHTQLIEGGEHFMIVDRASEVSKIINKEVQKRIDGKP
ncbi:hypothetical protein BKI52_38915 [marine bacterium AO1-C]|nr:hypothetical protein BKI52_38915 [marine bacterium AO1-C]